MNTNPNIYKDVSSSFDPTNSFLAIVTQVPERRLLVVPGMETYFASYPVVVYESTKQLLENLQKATAHLPAMVVIDISRSTDAGLNFLRDFKAQKRLRAIPVLMQRISTESSRGIVIPFKTWEDVPQPQFRREQLLAMA